MRPTWFCQFVLGALLCMSLSARRDGKPNPILALRHLSKRATESLMYRESGGPVWP